MAEDVVLTAAHCTDFLVEEGEDGFGPDDLRISFDPDPDETSTYFAVDHIVVHPDWFLAPACFGVDEFITGSAGAPNAIVVVDGIRSYREVSAIPARDAFPDRFVKYTASTCFGDSGGPLFHGDTVVGVNVDVQLPVGGPQLRVPDGLRDRAGFPGREPLIGSAFGRTERIDRLRLAIVGGSAVVDRRVITRRPAWRRWRP